MGRSHWHPAYVYVVGHGSRSRLGPDLVMPTASAWLGDQQPEAFVWDQIATSGLQ